MRLKFIILFFILWTGLSSSFYPFSGEDGTTVGKRWGVNLEANFTYFRYYSGGYHQDYILQTTVGLSDQTDVGILVPYSIFYDRQRYEGFDDSGVFIKHIPLNSGRFRIGYKAQVNLGTGKEGIGYGETTWNINLIVELNLHKVVYNLNLVYIKLDHVEELKDSYGAIFGVFMDYKDKLSYGLELSVLRPENGANVLNTHVIAGCVYHTDHGVDLSFGVHKTLTYHPSFVDYGLLAGMLVAF